MPELTNPYEEILAKDPTILTPPEVKEYEELKKRQYPSLTEVALGITAAWVFYRKVIRRRLIEELAKEPAPTTTKLQAILSILYHTYVPSWVGVAAPAIVSGYRIGAKEAEAGAIPDEYLQEIAEGYADRLGMHLNEVSAQAMLEGFQAQINRKHPAARAARQVADAYGVPPRVTNTLVSVWNAEEPKKLVNRPVEDFREGRAHRVIHEGLHLRDHQIGQSEAWSARTAAKQVVWMYKQQQGVIPQDAKRTWVTAKDEKVCPSCGPLHRRSADIGKQFPGGVWTPPLHVNCRCDIILDFKPNDIDRELEQLFTYEEVGKNLGDDLFDRDSHGRFAKHESRKPKPRPTMYAEPSKIDWLYDQVKGQPLVAKPRPRPVQLQQTSPPRPVSLRPIQAGAIKARSIKARPIQANPVTDNKVKANPVKPEAVKPRAVPHQKVRDVAMPVEYQRAVVRAIEEQVPPVVPEVDEPGWRKTDVPLIAVVPQLWMGPEDDFIVTHDQRMFELHRDTGRNFFLEYAKDYWDANVNDLLNDLYPGGFDPGPKDDDEEYDPDFVEQDEHQNRTGDLYYYDEDSGHSFYIDMDSYRVAMKETIYGVPQTESTHLLLPRADIDTMDEDDSYDDLMVPAWKVSDHLGLEGWVANNRPNFVIINHLGPEAERSGQDGSWSNPGEFRRWKYSSAHATSQRLPFRTFVATPVTERD